MINTQLLFASLWCPVKLVDDTLGKQKTFLERSLVPTGQSFLAETLECFCCSFPLYLWLYFPGTPTEMLSQQSSHCRTDAHRTCVAMTSHTRGQAYTRGHTWKNEFKVALPIKIKERLRVYHLSLLSLLFIPLLQSTVPVCRHSCLNTGWGHK